MLLQMIYDTKGKWASDHHCAVVEDQNGNPQLNCKDVPA